MSSSSRSPTIWCRSRDARTPHGVTLVTRPSRAVDDVLAAVQDHLRRLHPEQPSEAIPLAFWAIDDDELFMEALEALPLHMGIDEHGVVPGIERMPEGFGLAFPIFWLEDDYAINGWTALTNAGEGLLPSAIAAYDRVGMRGEARALEAALAACRIDPHDEDAATAAYHAAGTAYADDERHAGLLAFFRANRHLFHVPWADA